MKRLHVFTCMGIVVVVLALAGVAVFHVAENYESIWVTEYHQPAASGDDLLADDTLDSKKTAFDPELVRADLVEGWEVNLSDAVIKLDVPIIHPDVEHALLALHRSYAAAVENFRDGREGVLLPSVNLIDGKAKQFDDGLYAALDLAYFQGLSPAFQSQVEWVKKLRAKFDPASSSASFLSAALELATGNPEPGGHPSVPDLLSRFGSNSVRSKPIGFYTWTPELTRCFEFSRFMQTPFENDKVIPRAIADVLKQDASLYMEYQKVIAFYSQLTNPPSTLSLVDMVGKPDPPAGVVVSIFPPSTSRHAELFTRLFGQGLPPEADVMRELIRAIRSGNVSLQPRPSSGWFDYQVYALETLLLAEKGEESAKLLLTKAYKKRMLDAFKALMTKRIETHVNDLKTSSSGSAVMARIHPTLRIEPCPSYYVRTARAYAFLLSFLETSVGNESLAKMHGLRSQGTRKPDLATELAAMRDLFYGFYLVSTEDIGLKAKFLEGEPVDRDLCRAAALAWIKDWPSDPDLAVDTRVCVPILIDQGRHVTRVWATLGVRMTKLDASFARPPKVREADKKDEWKEADIYDLGISAYLLPVDEFAEIEIKGNRVLNREELREVCDKQKTKEAIIEALEAEPLDKNVGH